MDYLFDDKEIAFRMGESVKRLRLLKNIDRKTLCGQASVSMNALIHLENGTGATIATLIKVTRALDKTDWLLGLAPVISINPLDVGRSGKSRQRASRVRGNQLRLDLRKAGSVYFIEDPSNGNIKIGFSVTPHARLKDLQTGNSNGLTLIKAFPGTQKEEHELHERFKDLKIYGEWFSPGQALLDFIESI